MTENPLNPSTREEWAAIARAIGAGPNYVTYCHEHGLVIDGCSTSCHYPDLSRYVEEPA